MALAGQADGQRTRPGDVGGDTGRTNADGRGEALDCLIQRLTLLRGDLRNGDAVEAIFTAAAKWRAELIKDNH